MNSMKGLYSSIAFLVILQAWPARGQVVLEKAPELEGIGVEEHLGQTLPLNLTFRNAQGDTVMLDRYFHQGRPVILSLHYTNCPMLCSLVLNGLAKSVQQLDWQPGQKFQMLSVSIDPTETVELAAAVKARYQGQIKSASGADFWEFLIGPESHSRALAAALGFKYYKVQATGEYAHPAVVFVLTAEGKISRYLYGIEFKKQDLRLALLEASEGKIGNTVDRVILYCFHYDPDAKGYVLLAGNVMKLGGGATLALLMLFLGFLWFRESRRHTAQQPKPESKPGG